MARMIPPVIDPDTPSRSEIDIFRRLRDDPQTQEWTVLHSLNVANHRSQVEGEIDFVIIVPNKGILCLEVKSSRDIRRRDGLWYYGRAERGDSRGPFRQASEAMHSLRKFIVQRRPDLSNTVFWSAVAMPLSRFSADSTEWHPWQLINAQSFAARPMSTLVDGILTHARQHLATHRNAKWFQATSQEPYPEQCDAIASLLRGNFEFYESPKDILRRQNEEVRHFTDEQMEALESMDANPRVVFRGPAGTGKTLLAIEAARRAIREGRRPLLLCFNRLLGTWLEDQVRDLGSSLTAATLHHHLVTVGGNQVPHDPDTTYWQNELPVQAMDRLLETTDDRFIYDELIIDEAQDILRDVYLDVLDLSVRGGLAAGRWRMFGDFEKQAIYDASNMSVEAFLEERGSHAPVFTLRKNCRNTPRIAAWTQLLGRLTPNYASVLRPDDQIDPILRWYRTSDEQTSALIDAIAELYRLGYSGQDIVVLSSRASSSAAESIVASPWRDRLKPLAQAVPGAVGYTSIHAFKGREAPAVIVTDVEHVGDHASTALFYIAVSRPLHRLTIIAHERVQAEIGSLLMSSARPA